MTKEILDWIGLNVPYTPNSHILEIGSRNINGSPRSLFPNVASYIGVDQEPGPGVDMVENAHNLLPSRFVNRYQLIMCLEMLEHDTAPWVTVENMRGLLSEGGRLVISTPDNGFPEHRFPIDCFRFLPDAYREFFFKGMEIERIDRAGPCLIGMATKIS